MIKNDQQKIPPNLKYMKYQNDLLGVGSFKRVFKCMNVDTGVEYAWNEINLDKLEPLVTTKLFQEIQMYRRCDHPNIMKIHDFWFNDDNMLIFTTELVSGGSLFSYIHRVGTLIRMNVVQKWALQILEALAYLHDQKIIHRDLKAQNVYINDCTGQIKIGDLGLATTTQLTGIDIDKTRQSMVGTSEFMAPEIYTQNYDERADIFSYGMMLSELATKEFPYQECKHTMEIYQKVTEGVPPENLKKVLNAQLSDLIQTAIKKDMEQRPFAKQLLNHPFFKTDPGELCNESQIAMQNYTVAKSGAVSQCFDENSSKQLGKMSITNLLNEHSVYIRVISKKDIGAQQENYNISIYYILEGKELKTNFIIKNSDTVDEVVNTLENIYDNFGQIREYLQKCCYSLFETLKTRGLNIDEVFY